jgi:hypothetical protein
MFGLKVYELIEMVEQENMKLPTLWVGLISFLFAERNGITSITIFQVGQPAFGGGFGEG